MARAEQRATAAEEVSIQAEGGAGRGTEKRFESIDTECAEPQHKANTNIKTKKFCPK